jgi:3',5'-cyclic AMP phosphodiesterase CpdA
MPHTPDFIIHTGDLSQLSKPSVGLLRRVTNLDKDLTIK